MNIEEFRACCLSVKKSTESCPFLDNTVLVFKIMDKMFAYISLEPKDGIFRACMKCNPEQSILLREKYEGVTPSDFDTLLWNYVWLESDLPDSKIKELIDHSVHEVLQKLPKKKREEYLADGF